MKKPLVCVTLLFCIALPLYSHEDECASSLAAPLMAATGMFIWGTGLGLALLSRRYPALQRNCIINYIHSLLGPQDNGEAAASSGAAYIVCLLTVLDMYYCS